MARGPRDCCPSVSCNYPHLRRTSTAALCNTRFLVGSWCTAYNSVELISGDCITKQLNNVLSLYKVEPSYLAIQGSLCFVYHEQG